MIVRDKFAVIMAMLIVGAIGINAVLTNNYSGWLGWFQGACKASFFANAVGILWHGRAR